MSPECRRDDWWRIPECGMKAGQRGDRRQSEPHEGRLPRRVERIALELWSEGYPGNGVKGTAEPE